MSSKKLREGEFKVKFTNKWPLVKFNKITVQNPYTRTFINDNHDKIILTELVFENIVINFKARNDKERCVRYYTGKSNSETLDGLRKIRHDKWRGRFGLNK
jgi:hypothetical protein